MQGMMLSERPPASISTGMVDSSISIGNYKGVMLCNRPFAGAQGVGATGGASSGGPAKHVFNCGTVAEDIGLNKKRSDMAAVKRTKKETALTRHRKWLMDLQRTKEAADKEYAEQKVAREETKKKFMDREAKLRAIVRSGAKEDSSSTSMLNTGFMEAEAKSESKEEYVEETFDMKEEKGESSNAELDAASKKRAKSGRPAMPMWALTEDKAAEVTAAVEDDELEDLLDFAKNLDFDKYMGDVEVSTMLATVKARIAELEGMPDADEEFEKLEVLRGENRPQTLTAERISALQQKYGVLVKAEEKDDDTKSVANSILSENRDLGNIHSRKSVAALATARKAIAEEPSLAPPLIVTHTDDEGTRIANKTTVQNLPYMHRNPAL